VTPEQLHLVVEANVSHALAEDIGDGDVTASLVDPRVPGEAMILSREGAIICGQAWVDAVFRQVDSASRVHWYCHDGESVEPDTVLCRVYGHARSLLTAERTALNFLQTLSGTATLAHRYAEQVADLPVRILDTRKTIPGLRVAQKYAVRCGGCHNHRFGLYDGVLIKENHIMAAGSIAQAVAAARQRAPTLQVEVEVEDLGEVAQAVVAGADVLLLDDFTIEMMQRAVEAVGGRAKIEVSGGVTLETVRSIAATGVDYISIGSLTKHVRAVDLSMRFMKNER